jgi:hypothetical protein
MRYETVKELKDADFKRSTGVSREMFEKMLAVLHKKMRVLEDRRNWIEQINC